MTPALSARYTCRASLTGSTAGAPSMGTVQRGAIGKPWRSPAPLSARAGAEKAIATAIHSVLWVKNLLPVCLLAAAIAPVRCRGPRSWSGRDDLEGVSRCRPQDVVVRAE